jgi:hypothetical protein
MNAATITALIVAVTALLGAIPAVIMAVKGKSQVTAVQDSLRVHAANTAYDAHKFPPEAKP